uniref:Uncharacterized protein n=1 Tax=Anopheles dirus TaxID=7168 RepID=A0A182MZM2_9DIPT
MQLHPRKLFTVAVLVAICCCLLVVGPSPASALPGKSRTLPTKKREAPRHSLGTGARTGLTGAGVIGGILSSI